MLFPAMKASPVVLSNSRGMNAAAVAEHALLLMLAALRRLPEAVRAQGERRWISSELSGLPSLRGRTLLIVGLGAIGRELARMASALGMRVIGTRRETGGPVPEGVAEAHGPSALPALLRAPTSSCRRALTAGPPHDGRGGLALMKTAWLVNVARGSSTNGRSPRPRAGRLQAPPWVFRTRTAGAASPLWSCRTCSPPARRRFPRGLLAADHLCREPPCYIAGEAVAKSSTNCRIAGLAPRAVEGAPGIRTLTWAEVFSFNPLAWLDPRPPVATLAELPFYLAERFAGPSDPPLRADGFEEFSTREFVEQDPGPEPRPPPLGLRPAIARGSSASRPVVDCRSRHPDRRGDQRSCLSDAFRAQTQFILHDAGQGRVVSDDISSRRSSDGVNCPPGT
jgi:hypothetical protein